MGDSHRRSMRWQHIGLGDELVHRPGALAGQTHPRFPVNGKSLERAESWYRHWGCWSLLLSWVPVVGDPLTIAAGFLREPIWVFILLVSIAKIGRYLAIAAITANFI